MRAAGEQPRLGGRREVRLRPPERPRDGELRQRLVRRHQLDLVHDEPEAVAEVDERDVDGGPRRAP